MLHANCRFWVRRWTATIAALILLLCAPYAYAAELPRARIFMATDGINGFRVLPNTARTGVNGMLFHVNADGSERVLWQKPLVDMPDWAMVYAGASGERFVVTFRAVRLPLLNGLTIYDARGTVIKEFPHQPPDAPLHMAGARSGEHVEAGPTMPHAALQATFPQTLTRTEFFSTTDSPTLSFTLRSASRNSPVTASGKATGPTLYVTHNLQIELRTGKASETVTRPRWSGWGWTGGGRYSSISPHVPDTWDYAAAPPLPQAPSGAKRRPTTDIPDEAQNQSAPKGGALTFDTPQPAQRLYQQKELLTHRGKVPASDLHYRLVQYPDRYELQSVNLNTRKVITTVLGTFRRESPTRLVDGKGGAITLGHLILHNRFVGFALKVVFADGRELHLQQALDIRESFDTAKTVAE